MRKIFVKQRKNQDGSVLLAVITIMTFATILAATAFSFVRTASQKSYENVNEKQSYYTASTCLETFIESVLTPNNSNWDNFIAVAELGGVSQPIEIDGMGTCTIKVEKPSGLGYIKVISTAVVNDREETVVCYLKAITEPDKAVLENAVELTGNSNAAYNNLFVMGDMAGSNDENENMVYTFDNEPYLCGQYFQYGSIVTYNTPKFFESVRGDGTSITASKYIYFSRNPVNVSSNVKKQNNSDSNFVFANNAFVTATHVNIGTESTSIDPTTGIKPNDIDLFAHGIVFDLADTASAKTPFSKSVAESIQNLANSSSKFEFNTYGRPDYVQYGNIYCFANGETNTPGKTDGQFAGNMVLEDNAQVVVTGDVFVEGNIYISSMANLTIKGNLYVKGEILGAVANLKVSPDSLRTDTGKIYCSSFVNKTDDLDSSVFESFKSGRGSTPSPEYQGTKFIYHAEDLLISDDKNVSTISTTYKSLVTNPDAHRISNFSAGDYEGTHFDLIITDSCYIKKGDIKDNWKILVMVENEDVVIVFENGTKLPNNPRFYVKNETKKNETSDTLSPKFCYFTVDTYTPDATVTPVYKTDEAGNLVLDEKGRKTLVGSEHDGFVKGATLDFGTTESSIVDYDTWKNANIGIPGCGTQPFNLTGVEIPGTYTPTNDNGYIIMLLTEDTTVTAGKTLLEVTIYGRQAQVQVNNGCTINYALGVASSALPTNRETAIIGSAVVSSLRQTHNNQVWISYCPPSNRSNLANLGGSGKDKVLGYEVLKYTQDQT